MTRKTRTIGRIAATLLAATLAAGTGNALAADGPHGGGRRPGMVLRRALRALDLTEDQRDKIHAIFDAERPAFRSLRDQMKTDRQALKAAADANAGAAAVGTAFLKVRGDGQAIKAEMQKVRTQIETQLTPTQKGQLDEFITSMKTRHGRRGGF